MPKHKTLGNCLAPVPGGCRDHDGKPRPAVAKDLCLSHYRQFMKAVKEGNPKMPTAPIQERIGEPAPTLGPVKVAPAIEKQMVLVAKNLGISLYQLRQRIYRGWYEQQRLMGAVPGADVASGGGLEEPSSDEEDRPRYAHAH